MAEKLLKLAEELLSFSKAVNKVAGVSVMTEEESEAYNDFETALGNIADLGMLNRNQVLKIHQMLKKNMKNVVFSPSFRKFKEYFFHFYGEHGVYPIIGLNDKIFRKALKKYLRTNGHDFQGDSVDREHVRDIVFEMLGG